MNTQKKPATGEGNAPRFRYILTDGTETFRVKAMTEAEALEANINAKQSTDGNIAWVKAWNYSEI